MVTRHPQGGTAFGVANDFPDRDPALSAKYDCPQRRAPSVRENPGLNSNLDFKIEKDPGRCRQKLAPADGSSSHSACRRKSPRHASCSFTRNRDLNSNLDFKTEKDFVAAPHSTR